MSSLSGNTENTDGHPPPIRMDNASTQQSSCNNTNNMNLTQEQKRHRGYNISRNEKRLRRDEEGNRKSTSSSRHRKHCDVTGKNSYYGPPNRNSNFGGTRNQWKCLECSIWNDNDFECKRCRTGGPQPLDRGRCINDEHHPSRYRGHSQNDLCISDNKDMPENFDIYHESNRQHIVDDGRNAELDEFGRVKSLQPKKIRWPPCFDSNGSVYVLDIRSGMFYESISDFFYDPKSKLYYGNKQGVYFQYDPIEQNFNKVSENESSSGNDATTVTCAMEAVSTVKLSEGKKASITINLKTKSLSTAKVQKKAKKVGGSTKEKTFNDVPVPEPVVAPKQHTVDIEKWSERQNEFRQADKPKAVGDDNPSSTTEVVATSKGEPICLLCRRRFPNLDKLRHHEEVSNLHKENLAKQSSATKQVVDASANAAATTLSAEKDTNEADAVVQSSTTTTTTYIDRAEERRRLHQADMIIQNDLQVFNSDLHSIASVDTNHSHITETKNTLDERNIGHQMLQKLGWKSGSALGKKIDTIVDDTIPPPSKSIPPPSETTMSSKIQKDWDRMEAVSNCPSQGFALNKKGIGH